MRPPQPTPAAIGQDQTGGQVSASPAATAIGQKCLTCKGRGEEGEEVRDAEWGGTKIKEEEEKEGQEREEQLWVTNKQTSKQQ